MDKCWRQVLRVRSGAIPCFSNGAAHSLLLHSADYSIGWGISHSDRILPSFGCATVLAAVDGKRVGCPLCINGRKSRAEFLVRLTGGCRLNRNRHVLEACLGCLRIDLLKPLGCRLIIPMTLDEVLDLCQRVHCQGERRFLATVRIRCSSAALFDAYTSHC